MFQGNALNTIDEQLLTDLTAEQSAIVEGGRTLTVHDITAVKAGADIGSADDTYIRINGEKVWGEVSMKTGYKRNINISRPVGTYGSVSLLDEDGWSPDDFLGSLVATDLGEYTQTVSGSGSTYAIHYTLSA